MGEVDFGGSPATPYFGEEGREEKTAEARESAGEVGVAEEEPQFEPGEQEGESAEPSDVPADADSEEGEVTVGTGETDYGTTAEETETKPKDKKTKPGVGGVTTQAASWK